MTATVSSISDLRSPLAYARRYLALGWHVLPLTPGTKQPLARLAPQGVHSATNDLALIERWWRAEPTANIGVAVLPSKLVVIDVDPRNGGYDTMEMLEAKHGPLVSDVLAFTGGGGEHRVFSSALVAHLPGKLGPGVDVKADGYICVEPSVHPNGKAYMWEASSDPLDGTLPSTLPGWVRDLSRAAPVTVDTPGRRLVDAAQVADLRGALAVLPADDYHQWVNFGNALCELGSAGFELWDTWSATSSKYDPRRATEKWRSFRPGAFQIESIFFAAQQAGWVNGGAMPAPVPLAQVTLPASAPAPVPPGLLSPPGMLGVVTDWVNASSRKSQPAFAVQTAIAFASAVLGRRFVTTYRNWPSLYLLNVGKSASGKEHGKWAVEHLLEACGQERLIGPASYTSAPGLLSALHDQPSHITVVDEFGKELEQASVRGNARAQGMLKALMEAWGRCDGTMRPQGYSTFGMSARDMEEMKQRSIRNPALTMLAMTTPEGFFDTIGSAAARDGFLNRFLMVESDIGRQVSRAVTSVPVPAEIIDWVAAMHAASDGLVNAAVNASLMPTPVEVDFSPAARELFGAFDAECVRLMDAYEAQDMAEMFGRTNEMAMRLALVVSVGCASGTPVTIEGPHAAWAINYCRHHAVAGADRLAASVADSEIEAARNQVVQVIERAGARGMTERDLGKASRRFKAMNHRQQLDLLQSLDFLGLAHRVSMPADSGRGRPRVAWVAGIVGDADAPIPPGAAEGAQNITADKTPTGGVPA